MSVFLFVCMCVLFYVLSIPLFARLGYFILSELKHADYTDRRFFLRRFPFFWPVLAPIGLVVALAFMLVTKLDGLPTKLGDWAQKAGRPYKDRYYPCGRKK